MIEYKEKTEIVKFPEKFICDVCGEEQKGITIDEMHFINFTGGYMSHFGDKNQVKCDICHKCLYKMIGDHCRYNEDYEYYE